MWVNLAKVPLGRGLSSNLALTKTFLSAVNILVSLGLVSQRLATALAQLPYPRPISLEIGCDARYLYFSPGSADELHFAARLRFRYWEPKSRMLFEALARQSSVILDIGAYSGVFALTAAAANPGATVIVFEPNPEMTQQIRESININNFQHRVSLHAVALSNFDGYSPLYLSSESTTAGIASILYEPSQHPINRNSTDLFQTREKRVEVRSLDSYALTCVDLLKIDAEGCEVNIIQGAEHTIRKSQPIILSEALTPEALSAQSVELGRMGYASAMPVAPQATDGDNCNFLWVPETRFEEIRLLLHDLAIANGNGPE